MFRLATKMILFNLLAKGVILLGFLLAAPYLLKQYSIRYTDDRLTEKKFQVLDIIEQEGIESFFQGDTTSGYGSYNLLKEEYISLERIEEAEAQDTIFNEERLIEEEVVSYRVLSYTFQISDTQYLLEIGRSLGTIIQIESVISRFIQLAVILYIVLSLILDSTFHNYLLRPLKKIVEDKLPGIKDPGHYSYQSVETNTQDFKILDDAISDLMRRIQQVFNREREFIGHASHELRTPISVLQSKVENLLADFELNEQETQRLLDMQRTIQRFKHLVNSLLLISKIGNAQFVRDEQVDLQRVVQELEEEWAPVAFEKGLEFVSSSESSLVVAQSNYSMVLMMVQNALTNSLRYTPPGGTIKLSVSKEKQIAILEVSDTGGGISGELLEQVNAGMVFLKDANSEKSGFGLQIMHKIASYLNVQLTIDSSPSGTTVRFKFDIA
jgi:signal transduction histidine kinase